MLKDYEIEVDEVEVGEEIAEMEAQPLSLLGAVSGCKKLNVRAAAGLNGESVCVIAEGSFVVIDPVESTDEWWKVYTEDGAEGYCMKKYITVNE